MLLAAVVSCSAIFACNQAEPQTGAAYQEAMKFTENMRLIHKGMEDRLDFLKTENREFKKKVGQLEHPADSLKQIVALQDSIIQRFEGMCREQKRLIDQNEDLLRKQERRSLEPAKIAEQQQQIKENYERLQLHTAAVVQEVEDIKVRIDGAALTDSKTK